MAVTYFWIVYSCLIFGTGILCDRKLERRPAVSSCSVNTDDNFICSNGVCIEWPLVCDGHKDCSDGSDETKELCALYEFETNMTMDCGKVHNIKIQVTSEELYQSIIELAPWTVAIYRMNTKSKFDFMNAGSIISSNIVITWGYEFCQKGITSKKTPINDGRFKVGHMVKSLKDYKQLINVTRIYFTRDFNPTPDNDGYKNQNIAVIVLANKLSLSNGFSPICIDWFGKYDVRKETQMRIIGYKHNEFKVIQNVGLSLNYSCCLKRFHPHGDTNFYKCVLYDTNCIQFKNDPHINKGLHGSGLGIFYSNSYLLTGIIFRWSIRKNFTEVSTLYYKVDIKYYVAWIRGILNKHVTVNSCVLPTVEGVVYTYESSNEILSHGTLIDRNVIITENCEVGYHKAYLDSYRYCMGKGKWISSSDKLCFKMCPPLESDSLDIKCSYKSNYANCSNMSIPGTIATTSCKPTYALPNGQKQTSLELRCLANGTWDNELNRCNQNSDFCVLPTVEGVVYTYEDSNETLSPGTLIDLHLTVKENCTFGYYKAYPNSYRVCMRNGKWKTVTDNLCFKMCSPLESDSLDIKCSHNGKNTNCSKLSIPDTTAILSCKTSYTAPYGLETKPFELHCQYDGMWDKELYKCKPANSCVLPTVEGVVYTHEDSNEILHHGSFINLGVTVNENCTFRYHNVYADSFRVCQKNGKWKPDFNKLCLKMCPPLLSDSLVITCKYNGKDANCSNLSIPDTIATPKCKPAHTLPNGQKETPIELHCQSNGTWNNELYICEPDCGRPFIETKLLIKNGETANVGSAPWNVAIYEKKSDYEFICGGSIISRNLVVSAAHCFWKKGMLYNITIIDGLYKIAAGKYYKNFTIYENEYAQIRNVDRIHLKQGYHGKPGYYAEDIAVVVLQDSVVFSNGITPICIDWEDSYIVSNGDQGEVVGWGKTEKNVESPILLKTSLPYINMTTCRDMCKNGFESYVTPDKFCAGSPLDLRNIVDGGDSGAGLCFSHSKLYYLTGVVSLKEIEANNSIALFTSVSHHILWIRGLYNHYKKVQYN